MLVNLHTHTTFCDGKNTPEEIVLAAIGQGFSAVGFSGHGNTPFDLRYCMTDVEGYVREVSRVRQAYGDRIEILLGLEEDGFALADRSRFDYLIGSLHYVLIDGEYLPVDSGPEYTRKCLEKCGGDPCRVAESYYSALCGYLKARKPDIIGHFDLITKYDETDTPFFTGCKGYAEIARRYLEEAVKCGCLFEVNTGAMARGLRATPYPSAELLYMLKERDAGIILSSDSHSAGTLDFGFEEAKVLLREIGFRSQYTWKEHRFVKIPL